MKAVLSSKAKTLISRLNAPNSSGFGTIALLVVITIAGFILRLRNSDIRPLWLDEIHTFQVVNEPQSYFAMIKLWWNAFVVSDPPLYYILNYVTVGGETFAAQWKMRIISILFGTAAIPLMWFFSRAIANNTIALIAAALMALSTFAIQYSQEYRPYSQLLFFTLFYFTCQLYIVQGFSWRRWALLIISALLLLYTHYFGGFALASGYITWIAYLLYSKERTGKIWISVAITPVLLTLIYTPVIMYGLGQAQHFSGASESGGASEAILKMYLDQKRHMHYWSDLPLSLSTYYHGYSVKAYYLLGLGAAGLLALSIISIRKLLLLVLTVALFTILCYVFYEVMKYPYEPRRSIGVVPFLILFQSYGIYLPIYVASKFSSKMAVAGAVAATAILGTLAGATMMSQYVRYDSAGLRDQFNQADWPAMARYLKIHGIPNENVATYSKPGETWVSSHYSFYHKRYKVRNRFMPINSTAELMAALAKPGTRGYWYVVCFPTKMPEDLFHYLLTLGSWKMFYGGALVFVASAEYPVGQPQKVVMPLDQGYHALAISGIDGSLDQTVKLSRPISGELKISGGKPYALLPLEEGVQYLHLQKVLSDELTTPVLFKQINPGEWNRAIDFSEWRPGNIAVDSVLDDDFESALSMRYNGSVIYRFYLKDAGDYQLTFKVKNDAPGPIDIRLFAANAGELDRLSFDKADNKFSKASVSAQLKAGLNELTVYYPSFRRIPHVSGDANDTFNEFTFSGWRLDINQPAGPGKEQ